MYEIYGMKKLMYFCGQMAECVWRSSCIFNWSIHSALWN